MIRMLKILVIILLSSLAVRSQIYLKPNNSYGVIQNRTRSDSTALIPTFCGAPSGKASLHSIDQKMSALYFDSCAKKFYIYSPSDSSWTKLGATRLNDSMFIVGLDTIKIRAGGSGSINNIGSGHRAVVASSSVRTFFSDVTGKYDSTSNTNGLTYKVDTFKMATRYTFENMAELRAYDVSSLLNNTYIHVAGFYQNGDGGGGTFVWNSASTAADDSGTIIKASPNATGRWYRIYNTSINAFWFGAIPNGSRVVTSQLQNALNKAGHIIVPASTRRFIIDNRLLIKSNTFLEIAAADTIYLADSTNTVMIRNYTTDTVGITDHDIIVKGGIWDNNWANNPGTNAVSSVYKMLQSDKTSPIRGIAGTLDFCGIRNLKVINLTVRNGQLFPIHITHAENLEVGYIYFDRDVNSISDGVHLSTPQYNFYVHDIAGKNGDDVVALGAWEWLIANPGGQTGDIRKGTIERIHTDTCAWSLVKMYTGNTGGVGGIYDVTVRDVKGISKNQAFYWGTTIDQANPTHTTGYGMISNVTLDNVHAATLNAQSAVGINFGSVLLLDCNFKNIVVKNVLMDTGYTPASSEPWLRTTANANVKNLSIEDFTQQAILPYGWLFDLDGIGSDFSLTRSYFPGTGTFSGNQAYQRVRVINTGAWTNIKISNNTLDGAAGALWLATGATGALVNVSNNIFRNYNEAIVAGTNMNLSLSNNQFYNGATSVVSSYLASRISSAGNVADYAGGGVTLVRPSGSVKWVGTDLPVNVGLLTPDTYDMVNNTNSGAGDLGVAMYTGSAWVGVTASTAVPGSNGDIPFKSGSVFGASGNIHWDNTNNRLGIRTSTPIAALDVDGNDLSSLTGRFGSFGIQSFNNTNGFVINNGYYDNGSGTFKYLQNGAASWLQFASGDVYISSAASGTAGASMSSPTANVYIHNNNTMIGTTTDNGYKLQVNGAISTVTDSAGSPVNMAWIDVTGKIRKAAVPSGTVSGSGTSGRLAYWNGSSSLTSDANGLYSTSNNGTLSIGTTNTQGHLNIGGNKDLTATGMQSYLATATYTDQTTAASGTSSSFGINYIAGPTISAANTGVTFPSIQTLLIDPPTAGTNATITDKWALMTGANGNVRFQGYLRLDDKLYASSAYYASVSNVTTNTTISTNVQLVKIDASGGNVTVTLPAASSAWNGTLNTGMVVRFIRTDSAAGNTVTVSAGSGDNINGAGSFTITGQYTPKEITATSSTTWLITQP